MTDWREMLDRLSRGDRIKALLAFELASDRASGEPVEIAASTLRAVARAEGLDTDHPWIDAAARDIAQGRRDLLPGTGRCAVSAEVPVPVPTSAAVLVPLDGPSEDALEATGS